MRLTSSLLILFLSCIVICASAQSSSSTCSVKITFAKRADQWSAWMIGSTSYQIYDLTITNDGTCALASVAAFFSTGQGFISEAWNFNSASGLVSGYGAALLAGQSFYGAGFVLANSSVLTLTLTRPGCDASCSQATTAAPTNSAPTTAAPTTAAPTTTAPTTTAPTTTSAPAQTTTTFSPISQQCQVTATVQRDTNSWMDEQGRNTSVYRLSITNNGPCALKYYVLTFAYHPGTLVSYWNLEATHWGWLVQGFGDTLAVGQTYSAAGIIYAGGPDYIAPIPQGTTCAC